MSKVSPLGNEDARAQVGTKQEWILRLVAIICFLIITFGSYRIGRTVSDSYWKAKVQDAIEKAREEDSVRVFTSAGVNVIPTITCTTGMTTSGTGIIWSDSHD